MISGIVSLVCEIPATVFGIPGIIMKGTLYMEIQYEKEAAKHIGKMDTIFNVLLKFIPETPPTPEEMEAIKRADKSISEHGTVSHEDINWD